MGFGFSPLLKLAVGPGCISVPRPFGFWLRIYPKGQAGRRSPDRFSRRPCHFHKHKRFCIAGFAPHEEWFREASIGSLVRMIFLVFGFPAGLRWLIGPSPFRRSYRVPFPKVISGRRGIRPRWRGRRASTSLLCRVGGVLLPSVLAWT